jgi:hypothetical protein
VSVVLIPSYIIEGAAMGDDSVGCNRGRLKTRDDRLRWNVALSSYIIIDRHRLPRRARGQTPFSLMGVNPCLLSQ